MQKHLHFRNFTRCLILVLLLSPTGLWAQKLGSKAGIPAATLLETKVEKFGQTSPLKEFKGKPQMKDCATTLEKAINAKQVQEFLGVKLSPAQKDFLDKNKFLLIPKSETRFKGMVSFDGSMGQAWDEMLGLFDEVSGSNSDINRLPENVHLITPAVMLHAFHKYFQNTLEYIEKNDLTVLLQQFVRDLQARALAMKDQGGPLAARYEWIAGQFTVPLVLLENANRASLKELYPPDEQGKGQFTNKDTLDTADGALKILASKNYGFSQEVQEQIKQELKSIYEAKGVGISPLFGVYSKDGQFKCDYTQFTPRSHYAKSSALRAYFRAMMYLGRNGYLFETDQGIADAVLVAYLLASPGASGTPILDDWRRIMEVTGFFAGVSDDIAYPEWRNYLVKTLGAADVKPEIAVNPDNLKKIAANLKELVAPKIFSEILVTPNIGQMTKSDLLDKAKSFRIFGQRFTFDGWVLGRLTAGEEKSIRLPSTPSSVFVPAAFGSELAKKIMGQILKKEGPPFSDEEIKKVEQLLSEVAADLAKVRDEEWFVALNAAWLKLLGTLTRTYGEGFPLYMQSPMFGLRQLEDFLGSFAELRHDTLLYSKPQYAEMGEGGDGDVPPVPKGFVEPNMPFWYELQRLIDGTIPGLMRLKLKASEKEEFGGINEFKKQVAFFTTLAEKELANQKITDEEYEELRLSRISYMADPYEALDYTDEDRRSALIADIHTDLEKKSILYVATGEPAVLLALVGNDQTPRLTIGVSYNHYEFNGPLDTRYSDQAWQEKVYKKPAELPQKNFWYQDLLVK